MTAEDNGRRPHADPAVSVVGLGKLGLPIAAAIATRGFRVAGVDTDAARVAVTNDGRPAIYEPGLAELLAQARGRFVATTDIEQAVMETEATFVIVPTPSDSSGAFSLAYVLEVCRAIARALRRKREWHVVVITSTVMPGATGDEIRGVLEEESGKRCGTDFGLCYSPEFVALGSVIRDFLSPDFLLIGEADARSGQWLESFYARVCLNAPPATHMNLVNAEIAKISVNTYVTMKISFANMLAGICERIPGADVDVVTGALGQDSRIGRRYLKGAVSYGGPCFPRDNIAFANAARRVGAVAPLAEATDTYNRRQIGDLAAKVLEALPAGGTAAILGLAYKPETDVVEEAPGLLLAQALLREGVNVVAYDPVAAPAARRRLGADMTLATSAAACVAGADVVVVTTPWKEFGELPDDVFSRPGGRRTVIDCWHVFEGRRLDGSVTYLAAGVGPTGAGRPAMAEPALA